MTIQTCAACRNSLEGDDYGYRITWPGSPGREGLVCRTDLEEALIGDLTDAERYTGTALVTVEAVYLR